MKEDKYLNLLLDELEKYDYQMDMCSIHDHQHRIEILHQMVHTLTKLIFKLVCEKRSKGGE